MISLFAIFSGWNGLALYIHICHSSTTNFPKVIVSATFSFYLKFQLFLLKLISSALLFSQAFSPFVYLLQEAASKLTPNDPHLMPLCNLLSCKCGLYLLTHFYQLPSHEMPLLRLSLRKMAASTSHFWKRKLLFCE